MSGTYCIHCGLLMSSPGVTGDQATPGAAAAADAAAGMLHCPNCGGGNKRENTVCGWCDTPLPWANNGTAPSDGVSAATEAVQASSAAAGLTPATQAPTAPAAVARSAAERPTPAPPTPAPPTPVQGTASSTGPGAGASPAFASQRAGLKVPLIAGLAAGVFAVSIFIFWGKAKAPAPVDATGTTVVVNAPEAATANAASTEPAPDSDAAAQAATAAEAEVQQKTDAAQKAAAQATAAAKKAAEAKHQVQVAKTQAPGNDQALADAQDKARQAQADAEAAQAQAKAAQAQIADANARADQAAKDAQDAATRARAAEDKSKAAAAPAAALAADSPAPPSAKLQVKFIKPGNSDTIKLKRGPSPHVDGAATPGGLAIAELHLEAVVSGPGGDNISRAYVPNVGRKPGLISRVYYDVMGPNGDLVAQRRPVQLRWDGGISLDCRKTEELNSPSAMPSSIPMGTYTFRVFKEANDNVSIGQTGLTLVAD